MQKMPSLLPVVPFVLFVFFKLPPKCSAGDSLMDAVHRTQAAQERINDMWCYDCDTMDHGDDCVDVAMRNVSSLIHKCTGEEFICMVKRFSYTIHSENATISSPKMWSLARRCTVKCEAGCIVIGERTKLYACTSCCEQSLCNTGRGGAAASILRRVKTGIGTTMVLHVLVFTVRHALRRS